MTVDTFISLYFLDQILSTEFLSKISKILEVKIDINRVNLLIESYKKGGSKVEHFSCFHSSYQWGLNVLVFIFRTKFQFSLMCISSSFSLVCKSNNTLHTRFSAGLCTKRNFLCLHCCQRLDSGLDFFLLSSKKNHLIHSVWSI